MEWYSIQRDSPGASPQRRVVPVHFTLLCQLGRSLNQFHREFTFGECALAYRCHPSLETAPCSTPQEHRAPCTGGWHQRLQPHQPHPHCTLPSRLRLTVETRSLRKGLGLSIQGCTYPLQTREKKKAAEKGWKPQPSRFPL